MTRYIERRATLYVIATDSFMSGWGLARGRSLYGVACETMAQAENVFRRMKARPEMKRVRITRNLPRTHKGDHLHVIAFENFHYL